jgi:hypothetical protein
VGQKSGVDLIVINIGIFEGLNLYCGENMCWHVMTCEVQRFKGFTLGCFQFGLLKEELAWNGKLL